MRSPDSSVHTNQDMDETAVYLQAIENFRDKQTPLSEELDRFISYVAKTGETLGPWEKVQKVFLNKLELTLDDFYKGTPYQSGMVNANAVNDDFVEMKKRLIHLAEEFDSPPFTIQRLCELLSNPRKNYTRCEKFMRGLEKNLMVVSSWSNMPRTFESNERINGSTVGTSNGYVSGTERYKPHWSNLPPSPVSTAPPKIPGAPDFTERQDPSSASSVEKTMNKEENSTHVKATTEAEPEVKGENSDPQSQSDISQINDLQDVSMESPSSKRKISEDEQSSVIKNEESEISEESPTKRIKQEEKQGKEESKEGTEEIAENLNHDSAEIQGHDSAEIQDHDSAEMQEHDSAEIQMKPEESHNAESAEEVLDSAKLHTGEVYSQESSGDPENADSAESHNKTCGDQSSVETTGAEKETDTTMKPQTTPMDTN